MKPLSYIFFLCFPSYHSSPPSCRLAPNWLHQNHVPAKVWCRVVATLDCVSAATSAQFDRLQFGVAEAASAVGSCRESVLAFMRSYTLAVQTCAHTHAVMAGMCHGVYNLHQLIPSVIILFIPNYSFLLFCNCLNFMCFVFTQPTTRLLFDLISSSALETRKHFILVGY